MGCWVCNPLCGRCRKEEKAPKKCPNCGTFHIRGFYQNNQCNHCGSDLGDGSRESVHCLYSGLMCSTPCKRYRIALPNGMLNPCIKHKPNKA
ncbi:hypothetical protein LPY66_09895 [Dehalobacter sp. DCM]|uniref:hypothetical protein n=1 Tax=Dehalobacter sp. DCM TaxID=2907827 RepID=UPI003081F498|nr:hypothetical protein LPY66_09895 [Dehalobacter sp. DCM]